MQAAFFVQRLIAAKFAGEASPTERTPDYAADTFGDTERHEFPFVFAADEGVVRLMSDVTRPSVAFGDGQRFHEVPAGKIGAADVTDFAAVNQIVQGAESFFDGSERVEAVHLVDVNVIGFQAAQAGFAGVD